MRIEIYGIDEDKERRGDNSPHEAVAIEEVWGASEPMVTVRVGDRAVRVSARQLAAAADAVARCWQAPTFIGGANLYGAHGTEIRVPPF